MYKVKGVTKAVYIPVDIQDEVIAWHKEYQRLKRIMAEVSSLNKEIFRRHVAEKRLKKGRE